MKMIPSLFVTFSGFILFNLQNVVAQQVQCKLEVVPPPGPIGRPGKSGPQGPKGDMGPPGLSLRSNAIDSAAVEKIVAKAVASEFKKFRREMDDKLDDLKKGISMTQTGKCPILHDGKCYWATMSGERTTNLKQASLLCAESGGVLANVYSKKHFEKMTSHIKRWLVLDENGMLGVWTGMKYNPKKDKLTLSDGTIPSYINWKRYYPQKSKSSNTGVYIIVSDSSDSGMMNISPDTVAFGAFCENE